jgi:AcrR family transcriptional regulator
MGFEPLTPERRRAMTRQHLLDAAAIVFTRNGFHGSTLDEVAATAGFTKGAVYSNFGSKDEPTTGADVRTRSEILELVRSLAREGSAIVYSTHYLHEVEELAATIAFIEHGRIIARGELAELIQRFGASALELTFDGPVPAEVCVEGCVVDGSSVRIPAQDPARLAAQLLPRLGTGTAALLAIEIVRPSLESVFLTVTGRRYDSAAALVASGAAA